jgi:hypothetical protein
MASEKISQLTNGNPAQVGDIIPVDRSGVNYGVTAVSVAALASASVPAGLNVFPLPFTSPTGGFIAPATAFLGNGTSFLCLAGRGLLQNATHAQITLSVVSGSFPISAINIAKVAPDTWDVISRTPISFGSSFTPTLSTGVNTSDTFSMTFDPHYDYIIRLHSTSGSVVVFLQNGTGSMPGGSYFTISGDHTADSTVVLSGGNGYAGESWLTQFLSA